MSYLREIRAAVTNLPPGSRVDRAARPLAKAKPGGGHPNLASETAG